jgi:hypothetical protein
MQVLMLAVLAGCWEKKVKNLSNVEFDHYYALRVYMEDEQRKTYLKMKTEGAQRVPQGARPVGAVL